MTTGRITTLLFVLIGCLIAPQLGAGRFQGIFNYIQEFQGFISPGILAAFVFGLAIKRTPPSAGVTALLLTIPVYGILLIFFENIAFLNRMAITFVILVLTMALITVVKPLTEPKILPEKKDFDMKPAPSVTGLGIGVISITVVLYIIFW